MESMDCRMLRLEGHLNAMAQAWLYLAQVVETQGGMDLIGMEYDLRGRRWPEDLGIDDDARTAMAWLCDQLDEARERRQALARRSDARRETKCDVDDAFANVVPITRGRG